MLLLLYVFFALQSELSVQKLSRYQWVCDTRVEPTKKCLCVSLNLGKLNQEFVCPKERSADRLIWI